MQGQRGNGKARGRGNGGQQQKQQQPPPAQSACMYQHGTGARLRTHLQSEGAAQREAHGQNRFRRRPLPAGRHRLPLPAHGSACCRGDRRRFNGRCRDKGRAAGVVDCLGQLRRHPVEGHAETAAECWRMMVMVVAVMAVLVLVMVLVRVMG